MNYQLIAPRVAGTSPIEQVLLNRGIQYADIAHYLHTTDEDILPPSSIERLKEGVQMLIKHVS